MPCPRLIYRPPNPALHNRLSSGRIDDVHTDAKPAPFGRVAVDTDANFDGLWLRGVEYPCVLDSHAVMRRDRHPAIQWMMMSGASLLLRREFPFHTLPASRGINPYVFAVWIPKAARRGANPPKFARDYPLK